MSIEIDGLIVSPGLVYQEINLGDLFGVDVSAHGDLKERFAQACIDAVVTRCKKGLDFRGRPLPPYSEAYKESDVFKAYNKSSTPNEKLKGDMLASLDVLKNSGNKISIGWNDDNAEKARGHITGYEGHPIIKGAPKREFFGLTQAQLEGISLQFDDDIKRIKEETETRSPKKSEGQQVLEYVKQLELKKEQAQLARFLGIGFDDGE